MGLAVVAIGGGALATGAAITLKQCKGKLMTGLDIFALIVLAVLVASVLWVLLFLARWPGKIAQSRKHPQTDAIRVTGWLGILSLGVFWPLAFIWAHTTSQKGGAK